MKTWGKNHAFPTEYISNTLTRSVVPSLDITIEIYALIDRHRGLMSIQSTLKGDGFPNSEVFIYDSARTPLMLNTHHRFGNAAGQLVGDHKHILSSTLITVGINADACFIGPVHAKRCVDFKPWDHDLLAGAGTTDFSLANWNGLHLARNPSELDSLGLDTDDSLPIPGVTHMWPRSRKNGSSLWPKEVQSSDLDGWNH
jgi:hypothetical protein